MLGKSQHFARWGKDKNLVGKQLKLKVVDKLNSIIRLSLNNFSYSTNPGIQGGTARAVFFIPPMCGVTLLRLVVHALGADLNFNPLTFRTHDGYVQRFVAVGLGGCNPVAKPPRIGSVDRGNK